MTPDFLPEDKVLVLDFDHTCYDTDAFLLNEIRHRMLEEFKVPVSAWEEAYEISAEVGYSLERHREELIKILKKEPFSLEEIRDFESKIDFSKYLYSDTLPFITKAKKSGYKIMLLSFGVVAWQNKKVSGVGLDKFVDVVKYTRESGGKMGVLRDHTEGCEKVIFVENNGRELDSVRKFLPYVETYLMNRVPPEDMDPEDDEYMRARYAESRKIASRRTEFNHKRCWSFDEVEL